jgi:CBS domain-containing protein
MDQEKKQDDQKIIDAEAQKDLIRSEGEGFSVMYGSQKKKHVNSIKQSQAEKKKGGRNMRIKDIMTYDPVCCTADTNLRDVARMMLDYDCGEIPVVNNSASLRPVGVITDRDIICRSVALDRNPLQMTAGDCMSAPCVAVDPEATIEEGCRLLEEKQIRRLPVVDDQGCCGIVSVADIAAHKLRDQLAEVLEEVSQPSHRVN